nr:hypothetical protein [Tanacetum cinerariifolium]GEZ28224.1 hypothetical protein [Tanacetum cinerariifolium]
MEGLGQGRVVIQQDFNTLEDQLQQARAQITKLHRKQIGSNNKISLAHFRITELEHIINDIQICHQVDMENLQVPSINSRTVRKDHQTIRLDSSYSLEPSHEMCAEENKVTFATGTLTDGPVLVECIRPTYGSRSSL